MKQWPLRSPDGTSPLVTKPLLFSRYSTLRSKRGGNASIPFILLKSVHSTYFAEVWIRTYALYPPGKMVSVNILIHPWELCVLHKTVQGKAEGRTAFFSTSHSLPHLAHLLGVTERGQLLFLPDFFKVFQRWANTQACTPVLVQSTLWSYIELLLSSLHCMNGISRWWSYVTEGKKGRLVRLHFLGLRIRMQKMNAASALAKCNKNFFAYFWYVILSADSFFSSVQ